MFSVFRGSDSDDVCEKVTEAKAERLHPVCLPKRKPLNSLYNTITVIEFENNTKCFNNT